MSTPATIRERMTPAIRAGAEPAGATRAGVTMAVEVPGRDGVLLRGLMARAASPHGVVLMQTPYDAQAHEALARGWAGAGWSCIVVDVRGRYRSEGCWQAYRDGSHDGLSLLRGLLESGVLVGRESEVIVLAGASYAGMCALTTARRAVRDDPAVAGRLLGLVLTVPVTGPWQSAHDPSGLPRLRQRLGWWSTHGWARRTVTGPGAETLERWAQHSGGTGDLPRLLARLGAPEHVARAWAQVWRATPSADDRVPLPLMVVSGAHDHFSAEAEDLVRTWSAQAPAALISGPWDHSQRLRRHPGPWQDAEGARSAIRAAGPTGALAARWLERQLDPQPPEASYRTLATGSTSWQYGGPESAGTPVDAQAQLVALPADVPLDLPSVGHASGTTLRVDLQAPGLGRARVHEANGGETGGRWVVCEVHQLLDGHRRTVLQRSLPLVDGAVRGELHGLRLSLRAGSRAVLHVRGPTAFR